MDTKELQPFHAYLHRKYRGRNSDHIKRVIIFVKEKFEEKRKLKKKSDESADLAMFCFRTAFKNYGKKKKQKMLEKAKRVYEHYVVGSLPLSHPFFSYKKLFMMEDDNENENTSKVSNKSIYSNILEQVYGKELLHMFQTCRLSPTLIDILYNQRVYWHVSIEDIRKPSAPFLWTPFRVRWYTYAFYHNQPNQKSPIIITEWMRCGLQYKEYETKIDKTMYDTEFGKVEKTEKPIVEFLRVWDCMDLVSKLDNLKYDIQYIPIVCILRNWLRCKPEVEEWEFDALLAVLCWRDINTLTDLFERKKENLVPNTLYSGNVLRIAAQFCTGMRYASCIQQMLDGPFGKLPCLFCGSEFAQLHTKIHKTMRKQYSIDDLVTGNSKSLFISLKQDIVKDLTKPFIT